MEIDNGRYRFIRRLGAGGTGVVYQAADTLLGRTVAIKALQPSMSLDLLRREGRSLAQVSHPDIVQLYDLVEWQGRPYLIMEYIDGCTLEEWLALRGSLETEQALAIFRQIATAIGTAHQQGVLHCDLKPANVLLTTDGRIKLTDFTLARQQSAGQFEGTAGSSAGFAAPEQLRHGTLDQGTDIYALGAVLSYMIAREPLSALRQELQAVLARAMAPEPSDRFATVVELLAALPGSDEHITRITAPSALASLTRVAAVIPDRDALLPAKARSLWWWRSTGLAAALGLAAVMLFTHFTASASPVPIALPNLIATQATSATLVLRSYHLETRLQARYSSVPTGIVIGQQPVGQSHVQAGTMVVLLVSKGPRPILVPAVLGQNIATARNALHARGFQVRVTISETLGHSNGEVLDQSAAPSSTLLPGNTIVLTVAQKPWWDLGGIL